MVQLMQQCQVVHDGLYMSLVMKHGGIFPEQAVVMNMHIMENTLGKDHPNMAPSYYKIGNLMSQKGDHEGAFAMIPLCDIKISILKYYHDIETTMSKNGDDEGALAMHEKSLAMGEKGLGNKGQLDIASDYQSIAMQMAEKGDFEGALAMSQKCRSLRERVLGIDHLKTAEAYNSTFQSKRMFLARTIPKLQVLTTTLGC